QLVGSISPGAVSRKRKHRWPSQGDALEHFRHKKAFSRWDPQVLHDYVAHGTHDEDGQRVLSFERDIETRIYNTLPDNLDRVLRRHPLKCPVAFIGGLQSAELRQVGLAMTQRVANGRIAMLDGSHLFPMEKPVATAAAIEASLRSLEPRTVAMAAPPGTRSPSPAAAGLAWGLLAAMIWTVYSVLARLGIKS